MVTDWGQKRWPNQLDEIHPTVPSITRHEWEELKDLIKRALDYDKRTGQPECADPKKAEWLKKMSDLYDKVTDEAIQEICNLTNT